MTVAGHGEGRHALTGRHLDLGTGPQTMEPSERSAVCRRPTEYDAGSDLAGQRGVAAQARSGHQHAGGRAFADHLMDVDRRDLDERDRCAEVEHMTATIDMRDRRCSL